MQRDHFQLLFICTANICRSPIAEALARSRIEAAGPPAAGGVRVGSAGIRAHDGAPMDPRARAVLESLGVRTAPFAASNLTPRLMDTADLVLTAQREHRAAVLSSHPGSHARVFTLLEFARIAAFVDHGRLPAGDAGPCARGRELVREATRLRGLCPPAAPGEDDIADPFTRPARDFERCAVTIGSALDRILPLVAGPRRPSAAAAHHATPAGAGRPLPR